MIGRVLPRVRPGALEFLFLAFALPALMSSAASAAELYRGRCHMDQCSWYSIEGKELVASNAGATLFKVTTKTWTSKHPGGAYKKTAQRVAGDVVSAYYKCSKTKPAYAEAQDGKWAGMFLDLRNPPGFLEGVVMEYFVVCHGFDTDKSKSDFDVIARKFGYRKVSGTPDSFALSRPEELLTH